MNSIMNISRNTSEIKGFEIVIDERYARVYAGSEAKAVICELLVDYVPIEDFKNIFLQISEIIKKGDYDKFIFDKRALRAFHQPSMEWYYLSWKNEMLQYGIVKHRKLLPKEKWFEKMVMIAKEQIVTNNPDNVVHLLDIKYCDSIEQAISK
jgi:hypothetical protein